MNEEFIAEPIAPLGRSFAVTPMARGEPGLPARFRWRDREYRIESILDQWKDSGPCTHGSQERYLRKHWYKVKTETGEVMTLYFERQARSRRQLLQRWWLYATQGEPNDTRLA